MNDDQSGYSVDVVVIGGGFAGLAAGIESRLAGASVLLVEKMARPGGNSIISDGGMNAAGSSMQKAQDIDDSPELMYQDMLKAGKGLNSPALAKALVENAVETLEWTRKFLGVKFKDRVDQFGGHSLPRTHITQRASGVDIVKPMVAKFQELGGQLRVKTLMRELITQSNAGVVGVKLQSGFGLKKDGQGETYKVLVNCGVVMASGGFGADVDFRSVRDPRLGDTVDTTNKPTATAEGLKALLRIGAAPVHLSHIQLGPWCSPDERYYGAPPFYAARIWPKVHHTMGGARIDAKTRVLDLEGQPIPRLFAAGEVTGGLHGACRLGGNAIT